MSENLPGWNRALKIGVCEHCDSTYLLPVALVSLDDTQAPRCPTCFRDQLAIMNEGTDQLPYLQPPELFIPFAISADRVRFVLETFATAGLFQPPDLKITHLMSRLQRVYLPVWLVDAEVVAQWKAETGFNYEVVSHQNHFDNGQWVEHQVAENRVRWEPRVGSLKRGYHNITAQALETFPQLGEFPDDVAQPYRSDILDQAFVRLPDRPPHDAWNDALVGLRTAAQIECREAAGAQHVRDFGWQADFENPNWTQKLLPVLVTYYQDEDGKPFPIIVNGQSGAVTGVRRASMPRATFYTMIAGVIAVAAFLISAGLQAADADALSKFFIFIGLISFVLAALPPVYVMIVNQEAQHKEQHHAG